MKNIKAAILLIMIVAAIGFLIHDYFETEKTIKSLWENASKVDSVEYYKSFLKSMSEIPGQDSHKYIKIATKRIDALYWKEAKNGDNLSSYFNYVANSSNGAYVSNVLNRVIELSANNPKAIMTLVDSLQHWNVAKFASEALDRLGWQVNSIEEKVHYGVAKRDGAWLKAIWPKTRQVLLKDIESLEYAYIENALYAFIGLGKKGIIPELIEKLNEKGNKTMAEAFLNCGNSELKKAAEEWAERHGFIIKIGHGAHPVSWGSWY